MKNVALIRKFRADRYIGKMTGAINNLVNTLTQKPWGYLLNLFCNFCTYVMATPVSITLYSIV